MAEISRPWQSTSPGDAGPYSSANWHDIYKYLFHALYANSGAILDSGTPPNTGLNVQATAPASAAVDVLPGAALVEGVFYESTATETLAIAANLSGNPRIDTVILQKDYVAQTVRLAVLTGTPAVSPAVPSLTQNDGILWEIPLADIAVANGFLSISSSDITPRHEWANAADGVYLYGILNNSGQTLQTGDVVIWDNSANRAVTITTKTDDKRIAGVWVGRTLNGAYGRVQKSGIGIVRVGAAVTRGNRLGTGTTATEAADYGNLGKLGIALQTAAGAGLIQAEIRIQLHDDYINIQDQKAQNTDGGTFTSGAWQTRVLNTEVQDVGEHVSVAANQITLEAGTYRCRISAPALAVGEHQTRLQNITDGTTTLTGTVEITSAANGGANRSFISGRFTITAAKVFEVQHRCTTTHATNGFGAKGNFTTEVYSIAEFWFE